MSKDININVGGSNSRKSSTGKTLLGLGITAIGAIAILSFLKNKKDSLTVGTSAVPAEQQYVPDPTIITLDNIQNIAADESLAQADKIAEFQTAYNEQFIELQTTQNEITQAQADLANVKQQIAEKEAELVAYQNNVIENKGLLDRLILETANRYNIYIQYENIVTNLEAELASIKGDIWKVARANEIQDELIDFRVLRNNTWNAYLDATQNQNRAENGYNNAIDQEQRFKEQELEPLRQQKIAIENTLNNWQTAYQAIETILTRLHIELDNLGASVEPEGGN